jgi:acyl-CoA thioesterase I
MGSWAQGNIVVMARRLQPLSLLTAALAMLSIPAACGSRGEAREGLRQAAPANVPAKPAAAPPKIVVLGDSLTAGLGLAVRDAYPSLLQERLKTQGLKFEVVNAGVSGDTSAGALSRLDWSLQGDVRVLVVALGGNDGLRGLPPEQLQRNLAQIIERAQARRIEVILAGMEAPPNYGRDYIVSFHKVYPALSKRYGVPLVPFLLQGVAGTEALNQADGIHPTAAGARIVADNVWAVLKPVAERLGRPGS